jgi:hypothetical protein
MSSDPVDHGSRRFQESLTGEAGETMVPAIDAILTPIAFVRIRGTEVIYRMERTGEGGLRVFEVRFQIDPDGLWRLSAF